MVYEWPPPVAGGTCFVLLLGYATIKLVSEPLLVGVVGCLRGGEPSLFRIPSKLYYSKRIVTRSSGK